MQHFEVAVVGGGLAGSVATLALARSGRKLAFIAPALEKSDERTTALMDQSIRFLERLGVWENIAPSAAPLSVMQIIDATKRLLRAPTAQFRALDVGLYAFGYNIPNNALTLTLDAAVAAEPNITKIEQSVETLDYSAERVAITLAGGSTITTDFVVGADGRKSKTRDAAGIGTRTWSYPQSALVLNFSHTLPHSNVSTEFHTETGPFTQVPLPGLRLGRQAGGSPAPHRTAVGPTLPPGRRSDAIHPRQGGRGRYTADLAALQPDGGPFRQGAPGADW
jgi:2-octaprenyl-6-methoxyphenol hydroxylase